MTKKTKKAPLVKITITLQSNGKYDVVREREATGERAVGFKTLRECFEYLLAYSDRSF